MAKPSTRVRDAEILLLWETGRMERKQIGPLFNMEYRAVCIAIHRAKAERRRQECQERRAQPRQQVA